MQAATTIVKTAPMKVSSRPQFQIREAQLLIGNAALLKEQLPGRDGSSNYGDHLERQARRQAAGRDTGYERVVCEHTERWPQLERHQDPSKIQQAKEHRDAFPPEIAAGDHHGDQPDRHKRYAQVRRHAHLADRQSNGGEFRDQRQEI
jgi:hypothetical protein